MTSQNTSHAVMQQRSEPLDSLDDFPTPPWATRALCEYLTGFGETLSKRSVLEPACNRGYMARPLNEYFAYVCAVDVHHYGEDHYKYAEPCANFLEGEWGRYDWVITNPPFTLAAEFIERGLEIADEGVAVLVRTSFLEGGKRYREIFSKRPPTHVLQFVERVPMVKGRYDPKASTATSYCWLVWEKHPLSDETVLDWIAPCRKRLERESDYI